MRERDQNLNFVLLSLPLSGLLRGATFSRAGEEGFLFWPAIGEIEGLAHLRDDSPLRDLFARVEGEEQNDLHDPRVRHVVRLRARDACEYCLHPTTGQCEIAQLIPLARLWPTQAA